MRIVSWILVLASVSVLAVAMPQLGTLRQPSWAFQVIDSVQPTTPEESQAYVLKEYETLGKLITIANIPTN